ncbi:unnamed protein product [Arctogadus glacialis]
MERVANRYSKLAGGVSDGELNSKEEEEEEQEQEEEEEEEEEPFGPQDGLWSSAALQRPATGWEGGGDGSSLGALGGNLY